MQDNFYQYIQAAFPVHVYHDVMAIFPYLQNHINTTYTKWSYDVMCMGEQLHIPTRIYTQIPRQNSFQNFSDAQQLLLYSLYTRHNDSFVRQKMLRELLKLTPHPIMIPFIFQLL